jgi:hypothetical protein
MLAVGLCRTGRLARVWPTGEPLYCFPSLLSVEAAAQWFTCSLVCSVVY